MSVSADEVRRRAGDLCEYCRMPQAAFVRAFHIEHIIAKQHGGPTEADNLALACWHCNWRKGPNLSGVDSETGQIVPLFHPRRDKWPDHFSLAREPNSIRILGLTATGRATVQVLDMNDDMRRMLRYELSLEGLYGSGL